MNSLREEICSAKTLNSPHMSLLFQNYFFATVEEQLEAVPQWMEADNSLTPGRY
jgi:hypothetical protein